MATIAPRSWISTGLCHFALIAISYWMALLIRFDFALPPGDMSLFWHALALALGTKILVFYARRIHLKGWWRYLGFVDIIRLLEANLAASAIFTVVTVIATKNTFPRSVYLLDLILCFLFSVGTRSLVRIRREGFVRWPAKGSKGLLIYGAGVAGITLAREIRANPSLGYRVLGFLDDDPKKHGTTLIGLPILGGGDVANDIVATSKTSGFQVDEIVVTMGSATAGQVRAALACGLATGASCRIVPGLGDLLRGKLPFGNPRGVCLTEVLHREPVRLDQESVRGEIVGRSILVTGAAGSIGSELCDQIASFGPRCLVVLDKGETELFRLEAALRAKYPLLNLQPEIANIRDARRVDDILNRHAVTVIYHAAAYKHVPMMERELCEALQNNILGTWNLVQAARRNGVTKFLLISTDKAVNPTSIMGVTKRISELIVSAPYWLVPGKTECFVCVRFGNVLISNGSVVPTFQQQIAAGGPVTVTHPDVRRYFMTVQEAVQLVLHASTMGTGSEVFVLDMGEPIRILDLARKLITLAGFVPDKDIEIRFTGLRPGEKVFEELNLQDESLIPTSQEKVKLFRGPKVPLRTLTPWIAELQHLVWGRQERALIEHLKILVPEYRPSTEAFPANTAREVVCLQGIPTPSETTIGESLGAVLH